MLYNAVAGGHKDILQLLLENGELQWKDYNRACLLRAVEENNKTAVNFIFRKTSPLPNSDERREALKLAEEKKEQYKKHWKTNEVITASQIVSTLNHAQGPDPVVESFEKAELLREESKIKTINAEVTSIDKSDLSSALPNEGDITLEREKVKLHCMH